MNRHFAHIRFPAVIVEDDKPVECALTAEKWCNDVECYIYGTSEKSILIDADGNKYGFLARNNEGECLPGSKLGVASREYIYQIAIEQLRKMKVNIEIEESSSIEDVITELYNKGNG